MQYVFYNDLTCEDKIKFIKSKCQILRGCHEIYCILGYLSVKFN